MPYYYDEDGEMRFTNDRMEARRRQAFNLATSHRYPLAPEYAGRLHKELGPAPEGLPRAQALQRVQGVLYRLGLSHLEIETVVEVLDESWQMILRID